MDPKSCSEDVEPSLWPSTETKYSSVKSAENTEFLKKQYEEDVREGMVAGPSASDRETASHLGCSVGALYYGAHAVLEE